MHFRSSLQIRHLLPCISFISYIGFCSYHDPVHSLAIVMFKPSQSYCKTSSFNNMGKEGRVQEASLKNLINLCITDHFGSLYPSCICYAVDPFLPMPLYQEWCFWWQCQLGVSVRLFLPCTHLTVLPGHTWRQMLACGESLLCLRWGALSRFT